MSKDAIPTEIIKLIINTLGLDAITPEEQQLGYFTSNKLQKLRIPICFLILKVFTLFQKLHFNFNQTLSLLSVNLYVPIFSEQNNRTEYQQGNPDKWQQFGFAEDSSRTGW